MAWNFLWGWYGQGKRVQARFIWSNITKTSCHWEQADSPDEVKTGETNWVLDMTRVAGGGSERFTQKCYRTTNYSERTTSEIMVVPCSLLVIQLGGTR
jgi:hypothetical protein